MARNWADIRSTIGAIILGALLFFGLVALFVAAAVWGSTH